jgi:putative nucleotidyltransferase with HDIG domain
MSDKSHDSESIGKEVIQYSGRWIARLGSQVVAQGGTPEQALQAAKSSRPKETPQIEYVPTLQPLRFSPCFELIRNTLDIDTPVYLVGGAVRDALRDRSVNDLDFLVPRDALAISRRVANGLNAPFYPLDEDRETGRIILTRSDGERIFIDFSIFQGPDLESDLRARDFTVNAIAVEINQPDQLLDPLGGTADLKARILRACSSEAFQRDPIRIIRGIRLAAGLNFRIFPQTRNLMVKALSSLSNVSEERKRDELFRILDGPQPVKAMRALDILGAIPFILPELCDLKNVKQSPPHIFDVWDHTLEVLKKLDLIFRVLAPVHDPEISSTLPMGMLSFRLGRYRDEIAAHFRPRLNQERSIRALLFLAALYHDIGKPQTQSFEENGRTRFIDHERVGAEIAKKRGQALHLSSNEINRLILVIRNHLRPISLAHSSKKPSNRVIFRYFQDCDEAGVDICLLSLADILATYGVTLPQERWSLQLDLTRNLLEAFWERTAELVSPAVLLTGDDLIRELHIKPGPIIGILLESIREAQAAGEVHTYQDAIMLAHQLYKSMAGS